MEKKTIEVEVRGLLSKGDFDRLNTFFTKEGVFKKKKERVLIDYSTYLPGQGIEKRTKDIRIRSTNGVPEIVVKLGAWGGSESREEIALTTETKKFDALAKIFGELGYTKGTLCVRNSMVYDYKGVEFALVEVPQHSYYFEAEIMADDTESAARAEQAVAGICADLHLELFTKQAFFDYIEMLNRESNEVFDYARYEEGMFAKRFGI